MLRCLCSTCILLCVLANGARGAVYQVTVRGLVTYALFQDVPVGTPYTVKHQLDSMDLVPSPSEGRYAANNATLFLPNDELLVGGPNPEFLVRLGNGAERQFVDYSDLNPSNLKLLSVGFTFPAGTLTSDAVPLELPLDRAAIARVRVTQGLTTLYEGSISSYDTIIVPELPVGAWTFCMLWVTRRRRIGQRTSPLEIEEAVGLDRG